VKVSRKCPLGIDPGGQPFVDQGASCIPWSWHTRYNNTASWDAQYTTQHHRML